MSQLSITQLEIRPGLGSTDRASFTIDRSGRRASDERKQWDAARLRKEGWSYRRISATLGVSYATVALWLDGWEAHSLPPREEAPPSPFVPRAVPRTRAARVEVRSRAEVPRPRVAVPQDTALAEVLEQNSQLLRKLDELTEAMARQQAEAREREARQLRTIEQLHRQLMGQVNAAVVGTVQKLLEQHLRDIREATAAE